MSSDKSAGESDGITNIPIPIFSDQNGRHNFVITVKGEKFYVQSGFLSVWSGYFHDLFQGVQGKNAKHRAIELKDISAEDFRTFLMVIYPGKFKISDESVPKLMTLADHFKAPDITAICEAFLQEKKEILARIRSEEVEKQMAANAKAEKIRKLGQCCENGGCTIL